MKPANTEGRELLEPKKPELQDFGVTTEEYRIYQGGKKKLDALFRVIWCVAFSIFVFLGAYAIMGAVTGDWKDPVPGGGVAFFGLLLGGGLLGKLSADWFEGWAGHKEKGCIVKGPQFLQIKHYEEAYAAYQEARTIFLEARKTREEAERVTQEERLKAEMARQEAERAKLRKLTEHWMSLAGVEFERELGTLYKDLGYMVQLTPTSGDQGIDLILKKGGKTTVVQCKRYKQPVGPAVARELFGSMVAFGANDAILACTGGFTLGVRDFVRGKPITLISASELVQMSRRVGNGEAEGQSPICPVPKCGNEMTFRESRGRTYWACTNYPHCKGVLPVCPDNSCGHEMFLMTSRGNRSWVCIRHPECSGTRPYIERSSRVYSEMV